MKLTQKIVLYQVKRVDSAEKGEGFWEFLVFVVILLFTGANVYRFFMPINSRPNRVMEGKTYVGAINRGQQAYFLEKEQFAESLEALMLGLTNETDNYVISVEIQGDVVFQYAQSKSPDFRSHVGAVVPEFVLNPSTAEERWITQVILCTELRETLEDPMPITKQKPTIQDGEIICAPTTEKN